MRHSLLLAVLFLVVAGIAGYWTWSALGSNSGSTRIAGDIELVEIDHEVLAGLGNGFFVKVDNSTFIASVKVLVKGERAENRVYRVKNGKAELLGKLDAPFVTDVPALWINNEVLLFGGYNPGNITQIPIVYAYNPENGTMRKFVEMPFRDYDQLSLLWDGSKAYLFVRFLGGNLSVYSFDPYAKIFQRLDLDFPEGFVFPGTSMYAAVWYKGKGYLVHGDRIAVFDPSSKSFLWAPVRLPDKYWARTAVATDRGYTSSAAFTTAPTSAVPSTSSSRRITP
ncbi:Kelch repeat-containing protein [Thermococcus profundus]|uniref:galactose oxidase n=1 Tax=Thermococcus profundus TaxID=49899 RepID=UPI001E46AA30|nr:galactose oxidase [Thermococcus profundus]